MSFLDKMIEKIGIVDEEYDEEEVAEEAGAEAKVDADAKKFDESVPPEFLQHIQRNQVANTEPEDIDRKPERVIPQVPKPVEKKESEKKGAIFGKGRKDRPEMSPVTALAKALHVVIIRPESFDDSQKIAEYLKREQTVIVNYERTDEIVTARINDFVCGVVYAVGGTIQRIDQKSMFCAPKMVDVDTKDMTSDED